MTAYAALVSLMHTIEQIKHHPSPPITLHIQQVESLTIHITCLQEYLERPNSAFGDCEESDLLEIRIADAAQAAEDAIESYIVGVIQLSGSTTTHDQENISCYQRLEQVIKDMDLIKIEVAKDKRVAVHIQLERDDVHKTSSIVHFKAFDDDVNEIVAKLRGESRERQVIPIVGMAGIGKTTLAKSIYENRYIKNEFPIRARATISKEYNIVKILNQLLPNHLQDSSGTSEHELGDKLRRKHLHSRRYLIVLDDMWSVEVWDKLRPHFPDCSNGSRIVVTTRLSSLGSQLPSDFRLDMKFLDRGSSWSLLSNIVFKGQVVPGELEKIGINIAENCRGLPLSIVVIGGLLAKSPRTTEKWESIEGKLKSIVKPDDYEYCLKVLKISYTQLPAYLRPCFLYMGVFEEDSLIRVSTLVKLWLAEGFLKPIGGKSLEIVAQEYLKGLIDRNLILVDELGPTGSVKYCKIHDLTRDLSLREALKERFYYVIGQQSPQGVSNQRRIVVRESTSTGESNKAFRSMPLARSIICDDVEVQSPYNFRLLRVLKAYEKYSERRDEYLLEDMFGAVNLRYLAIATHEESKFLSSVNLLWNLQTLIVDHSVEVTAPVVIWNMTQLRNVEFMNGLYLQDPPSSNAVVILENLHTLIGVMNFMLSKEVVERIPNIKKLGICYDERAIVGSSTYNCMSNLKLFEKLESLNCRSSAAGGFLKKLQFPLSLKKFTMEADEMQWNDLLKKKNSFPNLEKLELLFGSFDSFDSSGYNEEGNWKTFKGQFPSLKFLKLLGCYLENWTTKSSHFPRLEHLVLAHLKELKQIPSGVGKIPTLKSIDLNNCGEILSLVGSAKKILEKMEASSGEISLQVRVTLWEENKALLKNMPDHRNFHVEVI